MKKIKQNFNAGFTLVELLVVIAIIGILASVISIALIRARTSGRLAKVDADLHQLRTAVELLVSDTGKWPNGCPVDQSTNPEIQLDQPNAGINAVPTVGVVDLPCEWTAGEVALWNGPYVVLNPIVDPWGTSYWFDADYVPLAANAIVLLSYGPDKTNYTADDIYLLIK